MTFQSGDQTNTYHQTLNQKHIKSIRTDNSGVTPLKRDDILVTYTVEKADNLSNQFQSVYTNETDTNIPEEGYNPHSKMPQINISSAGVSKVLCNLNPHKACGPARQYSWEI